MGIRLRTYQTQCLIPPCMSQRSRGHRRRGDIVPVRRHHHQSGRVMREDGIRMTRAANNREICTHPWDRLGGSYTESLSSAEGLVNGTSRSHAGQRRMSRTSPSNEGGSSSSHGNEVPQEYRSEVERIFFDFLDSICSNRTYTLYGVFHGAAAPLLRVRARAELCLRSAPQWMPPIPRASQFTRRSWPRRCSAWTSRPTSVLSNSVYKPSPTPFWKR